MMRLRTLVVSVLAIVLFAGYSVEARTPGNKDFGFGVILGEATGISLIFGAGANNNLHVYAGNSYFGDAKIGADYLWYFNAFNSSVVDLYAGAGGFVGIGEGNGLLRSKNDDDAEGVGIGARGVMGVNFIPRNTPFEIFVELGLDATVVPINFFQPTGAIGFRFYP